MLGNAASVLASARAQPRSLLDFTRIIEVFDKHSVSFVSVTQQFNTASSLGRLVLNILLSFAQFEREMIAERTRDKMGAARRKGKWVGGRPPFGYDVVGGKLAVNADEAAQVLDDHSVESMAGLARIGRVTRARMTQLMDLTLLAPESKRRFCFWLARNAAMTPYRCARCGTCARRRSGTSSGRDGLNFLKVELDQLVCPGGRRCDLFG